MKQMTMFKLQHISNFDNMKILASQGDESDNTRVLQGIKSAHDKIIKIIDLWYYRLPNPSNSD